MFLFFVDNVCSRRWARVRNLDHFALHEPNIGCSARDLQDTYYVGDFAQLVDCESVDSALAKAEVAAQHIQEYKRKLREHRNSVIPVAKLPPETLSAVFRYCVSSMGCMVDDKNALAYSQVCCRWRTVALQDPALWTNPLCLYPDLGKIMIERAQNLPFAVSINCSSNLKRYALVELAATKHSQLSEFDVEATALQARKLTKLITGPMLFLEDMRLGVTSPTLLDSNGLERFTHPRLRSLQLELCMVSPSAMCLSNPTNLHINLRSSDELQMNIQELVAVLEHNTGIEKLVLLNTTEEPWLGHLESRPLKKVVLNSLRHLHLEEDLGCITAILWHFSIPHMEKLRLTNHRSTQHATFTAFFEALQEWLRTESIFEDLEAFVLRNTKPHVVEFVAYTCELDSPLEAHEDEAALTLSLSVDEEAHLVAQQLAGLFSVSSFRNVPAAGVESSEACWTVDSFMPFLITLPSLTCIELRENTVDSFLNCLEAALDTDTSPLPSFAWLELIDANMCVPMARSSADASVLVHRFASVLKRMNDKGRPIYNVRLIRPLCPIEPNPVFAQYDLDVEVEDVRYEVLW